MNNLKKYSKLNNWVKMWSAKGSLQFDSHLGEVWTRNSNISNKPAYKQVIFIYTEGITDCWVTKSDRDNLGKRLRDMARKDEGYINEISDKLIVYSEEILNFIDTHLVKNIKIKEYNEFWNLVYDYYLSHISVKYIVDYVSPEKLKTILPILEKARLISEPIYRNIENYFEDLANHISKQTSYTKEMILATTKQEMISYLNGKQLPDKQILKKRYEKSSVIFDEENVYIFTGEKINYIENIVAPKNSTTIMQGQSAYIGKIVGRVRIVLDPKNLKEDFIDGDILVSGMTRPEFLPLLQKSGGFVTDSGGVLSHAAISARELKKPCVIDTKNATKILKNGDLVEIDGEKGIVKIIK